MAGIGSAIGPTTDIPARAWKIVRYVFGTEISSTTVTLFFPVLAFSTVK